MATKNSQELGMLIVYVVKFYYRQIKLYEIYFLGTCDLFAYFARFYGRFLEILKKKNSEELSYISEMFI